MNLSERALYLIDNLDLPAASGVEDARWEHFQLAHLSDDSPFRIETKARQIAWSWTAAAEAIAVAELYSESTAFISVNLDEATEKIRYAKAIHDNLQLGGRPRLVRENILGLEYDNSARILSLPARPPRGKARLNVVLDEFAHVQQDREIYTAALPIISKGGRLRIGSSPLGASGVFWELFEEKLRKYPGYRRKTTPWWEVYAFCRNVKEARILAPTMLTEERVELFGNERIKAIFANMLLEDFQQEYEAAFVDETTAWIPWEIIQRNQEAFANADMHYWHASSVEEALELIDPILEAIKKGEVEPVLVGGIDIGRKKNLTEMIALGKSTTGQLPLRLMVSLDQVEFDDQQGCFEQVIKRLPFSQVLIDKNGLGMQLAENLRRTGRVEGVDFTNPNKELWAVQAKLQMERSNVPIPADRELSYQIHSIKKMVTVAKNAIFDTQKNEQHHADKWWALALAIWAGSGRVGELLHAGFSESLHVIEPVSLKNWWPVWMGIDTRDPFCCLWGTRDPDIGRVYVIGELYQRGLTDVQQARLIRDNENQEWKVSLRYAGPEAFGVGREATNTTANVYNTEGLPLLEGDHDPVNRKRKVDRLLANLPDGKPGLLVFNTCPYLIRALSNLILAEGQEKPEPGQEDRAWVALGNMLTNYEAYGGVKKNVMSAETKRSWEKLQEIL